MIKRYAAEMCGEFDYSCAYADMHENPKGNYVEYKDFQVLVQLLKEYVECPKCSAYCSAFATVEEGAIFDKIEQSLGKGWDK